MTTGRINQVNKMQRSYTFGRFIPGYAKVTNSLQVAPIPGQGYLVLPLHTFSARLSVMRSTLLTSSTTLYQNAPRRKNRRRRFLFFGPTHPRVSPCQGQFLPILFFSVFFCFYCCGTGRYAGGLASPFGYSHKPHSLPCITVCLGCHG